MRRLFGRVPVTSLDFPGDSALLLNCNTPEDYEILCQLE